MESNSNKLKAQPAKLWSLQEMEQTGGEPDVIDYDKKSGEFIFVIVRLKAQKADEVYVMIAKD